MNESPGQVLLHDVHVVDDVGGVADVGLSSVEGHEEGAVPGAVQAHALAAVHAHVAQPDQLQLPVY